MKNLKRFLVVGLALGLVGGGTAFALSHTEEMKTAKADDIETYIPMEASFFTNWTNDAGSFAGLDARFWGENYCFENLDTFYRGETGETWTGTLTSRTWKQSTQYIYFQLGGAKDYDVTGDPVHLKIHFGEYFDVFYNNTFVENPMTLRYFKIPDATFAALTAEHDDFDMYIEIIDAQTSGYGFANFGYLHVNQTLESTSDAMRYFLNHLSTDSREWEINKRKQIFNSYFDNEAQRAVFFAPVENVNESFSSNSDFVNHWYFDYNYFNNNYNDPMHVDSAISTNTYRPDANTNMPFNNDGGFFRGWYEGSDNNGFVASDGLRYRFISRPFVLRNSAIISVKMAGKASLQVLDATKKNTDGQAADLAWIDNRGLQMDGNQSNMAESGFNTTAMVNHVINLEAYRGMTIQLAIADIDISGWSACYFDEIVVNYLDAPAFHVDVAEQTNNSGTFYPVYFDYFINAAKQTNENPLGIKYNEGNSVNTDNDNAVLNYVDTSDSLAAYNVWKSYLDTVRGGKEGRNYCSALTSDGVKSVLNAYNSVTSGAKRLVCLSDDFERVGAGTWYNVNPTIYGSNHAYNLGHSLQYLGEENSIAITVYNSFGAINRIQFQLDQTIFVIVSICAVIIASLAAVHFVLKKRKEEK